MPDCRKTNRLPEKLSEAAEHLLEEPYCVIDLLPKQVSENRADAFSRAEQFFLGEERIARLHQRFISVLLKLNCYVSFQGSADNGESWYADPSPEQLNSWFAEQGYHILILLNGTDHLIMADDRDIYMTLFHPDDTLLKLAEQIAYSEGLFVRSSM